MFRILLIAHIGAGLTAVVAGVVAMRAPKGAGRHPRAGTVYVHALVLLTLTAAGLAVLRWPQDNYLLTLAALTLAFAGLGYAARRAAWRGWQTAHIAGMSCSYVTMLTAFYVDNGPHLPLWRLLPPAALWTLPALLGSVPTVRARLVLFELALVGLSKDHAVTATSSTTTRPPCYRYTTLLDSTPAHLVPTDAWTRAAPLGSGRRGPGSRESGAPDGRRLGATTVRRMRGGSLTRPGRRARIRFADRHTRDVNLAVTALFRGTDSVRAGGAGLWRLGAIHVGGEEHG